MLFFFTLLTKNTKLFQTTVHKQNRNSGSCIIYVTLKNYDGRTKPEPRKGSLPEPHEYKCLLRATLGNKKLSTVINQKDVNKFQLAYANLLKGNMDGLKKKDKKAAAAKSKSKATQ
ncbi:signal recognition particle 14 kDa protein-like [Saccostrea cucullata]|uniref:signal recognition particle 14 kDa protein-like n=1 Tax=Saccostrea cuccullata TaxID=36930 RepID=UPI002ED5AEDB